jgi:cytochrome P450
MFELISNLFLLCVLARYWKDPHTFKPERFLEDWPKDAFIPFSAGEL